MSLLDFLFLATSLGAAIVAVLVCLPIRTGVIQTLSDCVIVLAGLTLLATVLWACGVWVRVLSS